jgi:hypothetical protein
MAAREAAGGQGHRGVFPDSQKLSEHGHNRMVSSTSGKGCCCSIPPIHYLMNSEILEFQVKLGHMHLTQSLCLGEGGKRFLQGLVQNCLSWPSLRVELLMFPAADCQSRSDCFFNLGCQNVAFFEVGSNCSLDFDARSAQKCCFSDRRRRSSRKVLRSWQTDCKTL